MKSSILIIVSLAIPYMLAAQSFHDMSVTTSLGQLLELRQLKSQKVLFLVTDENYAVRSEEVSGLKMECPNVIFVNLIVGSGSSAPMLITKKDGFSAFSVVVSKNDSLNSNLMTWLQSKDLNKHFDVPNVAPGHKFIINEFGVLYAVLPESASFSSERLRRIMKSDRDGNRSSKPGIR